MNDVSVYGRTGCGDTQHTRQRLDSLGIGYDYIDLDKDAKAAEWVGELNGGKQKTPAVELEDLVLSVPSDAELDGALRSKGLMA